MQIRARVLMLFAMLNTGSGLLVTVEAGLGGLWLVAVGLVSGAGAVLVLADLDERRPKHG